MPAPNQARPILPGGRISAHELDRLAKQAAQATRITTEPPLKVALGSSGYHFSIDTSRDVFLARLTSVQAGSGSQASLRLYGFREQTFDPSTGIPTDAVGGRQDNLSSAATMYALEDSNQSLTVPGSTPSGYTNAGPYVEMRLKGVVGGANVYEFTAGQPSSGSGIALLDKTGATVDAACTSLKADTDGVLTFTHYAANSDQVVITDASFTQRGVINLLAQRFKGQKDFADEALFEQGLQIAGSTIGANGNCTIVINTNQYLMEFKDNSGTTHTTSVDSSGLLSAPDSIYAPTDLTQGPGSTTTTATTGFLYISVCSGTPTGVPGGAVAGFAAMRWDDSNHKLWVYSPAAAAWKGVVLT